MQGTNRLTRGIQSREQIGRQPRRQGLDDRTATDDSDQKVRNHEPHQDWKQQQSNEIAVKPITKELNLGRIAVPPRERPDLYTNQERNRANG